MRRAVVILFVLFVLFVLFGVGAGALSTIHDDGGSRS